MIRLQPQLPKQLAHLTISGYLSEGKQQNDAMGWNQLSYRIIFSAVFYPLNVLLNLYQDDLI